VVEHMYSQNKITGHFAMWAVRQSPFHTPDNLGMVISQLIEFIRDRFSADIKLDRSYIFKTCESEMLKALDEFVKSNVLVRKWSKIELDYHEHLASSHEVDVIDLDALVGNVCRTLHQEVEKDEEFNKEVDDEWDREQNRNE